jgi:DNA-binding CsgD family transcriptional regulator
MLDEAMVAVLADDLPPIVSGSVFCGVIDACQGILDVRRTREWTAALSRWCDAQPDLVLFRGECLVHRAEVMQLHGDWQDAAEEAERAGRLLAGRPVLGEALYRSAELYRLRGEAARAEDAYRAASLAGREPQPGLALLRLTQSQAEAAVTAIRRVLGEAAGATTRARLLGAYVEIMLATGDVAAAGTAAEELDRLAAAIGGPCLRAMAAAASGAVLLANGKPMAALPVLREAWAGWRGLEIPYEAARTRMLIGMACRAMDDNDSGDMELDAARLGFQSLGATVDVARVEALLTAKPGPAGGLTGREREVLALVAKGSTNREIAAALVISEHTVARHVQNILGKLGVPSRTAAGSYAYEHGLV